MKDIDDLNNASAKYQKNLVVEAVNIDLPKLEHSPFGVGNQYFTGWTAGVLQNGVDYQKSDWELQEPNYRVIGLNIFATAHADDTWHAGNSKIQLPYPS